MRNMLRMSMTVTRMPASTRLCRAFVLRILSYDERRKNAIRLKAHAQASGSKPGLSQCHGQRRGLASRNPRDSFRRHPHPIPLPPAGEGYRGWRAFLRKKLRSARTLHRYRLRERVSMARRFSCEELRGARILQLSRQREGTDDAALSCANPRGAGFFTSPAGGRGRRAQRDG